MEKLLPIVQDALSLGRFLHKRESGTYCTLCGTGAMTSSSVVQSHIRGDQHKILAGEINRVRDFISCADQAKALNQRAEALEQQSWTDAVQSALLRSMMKVHGSKPMLAPLASAKKALLRYEIKERLSLLELAVWKAACTLALPRPLESMFGVYVWQKEGWKTNKSKCRDTNSIHIIVSRVLPFIEES